MKALRCRPARQLIIYEHVTNVTIVQNAAQCSMSNSQGTAGISSDAVEHATKVNNSRGLLEVLT